MSDHIDRTARQVRVVGQLPIHRLVERIGQTYLVQCGAYPTDGSVLTTLPATCRRCFHSATGSGKGRS